MRFAILTLQGRDAALEELDLFLLLANLRIYPVHFQVACIVRGKELHCGEPALEGTTSILGSMKTEGGLRTERCIHKVPQSRLRCLLES